MQISKEIVALKYFQTAYVFSEKSQFFKTTDKETSTAFETIMSFEIDNCKICIDSKK